MTDPAAPAVAMRGIAKRFGAVQANADVDDLAGAQVGSVASHL